MKTTFFLFPFIFFLPLNNAEARASGQPDSSVVTQNISYSNQEATEVYLVWGINNWTFQEENLRPEGTYIKGNLMYTPMKFENGIFSTQMKVKCNTMINYVFWITKGPLSMSSDVWDTNKTPLNDYQILTINDNTTLVESVVEVKPKEPLSLLNFSWSLLITITILFFLFFAIKKYRYKEHSLSPGPRKIIIASAGILLLALFFIRTSVLWISWDLYFHPLQFMPQMLWAGFYDFLYVDFLTIAFLLFLFAFKKYPRTQSVIAYFFIAIGLFSLIAGILNIRIVQMLGNPFNYRWLYYSDFLNSADAKAALASNISSDYIIHIIAICLAAILCGILIISIVELLIQKYRIRKVLLTLLIYLNVGYILFGQKVVPEYKWSYDKLANPVTAFFESVNPFSENPALFTMEVPDSLKKIWDPKKNNESYYKKAVSKKIKNVIVFVMESTPAEYIQPYDTIFHVTPELEKYLSNSIVFENIYAHAPATNKSMVSILGSVYPWLSYTSITQERPDIDIPTISSELKEHGYRTAFFNSADNCFQKADEFLGHRKFDVIKDCKNLSCKQQYKITDEKRNPLSGIDDECTGKELINWIKKDPSKPFFGMMWTYQTHYPYYATGEEKNYTTSDPILNRYLNATHHSDMVLGQLLDELKKNNLFESTLVIVIGDHGEAFGRHNQTTHASGIYEENLHIPCIFLNPLFKGENNSTIGGTIDIAPTVMNILGLPTADKWQGQSLFAENKNKRVYFFCPWSDYLFGYREGNRKYIFNATKNSTEIYDLKNDPQETKNLAPNLPKETEHCHQCIAAWVQYQNKFMGNVLTSTLDSN